MLLIGTNIEQARLLSTKYKQKFNYIEFNTNNSNNNNYIISFIESVKQSMLQNDITFVVYNKLIIKLFNSLKLNYSIICNEDENLEDLRQETTSYIVKDNSYEKTLYKMFNWIDYEEQLPIIPEDKNKLTFEQLLDENVSITEADVRGLKETQNKLKVGMLLQAKNSLNRILKLTNVLDKLYDELVDRIDMDLTTTDTASIMYTADYISKALQDTNKLIVDLISNDKIQNFFIIDNSQTLNLGDEKLTSNERADVNSREKIRKAAEIVLKNLDLFQQGNITDLKNPNEVFVEAIPIKPQVDNIVEENIKEGKINDSTTGTI